jgi:hypothetical protein
MSTTTTDTAESIDWWEVMQAAQGLGINTRRLIALHDVDGAIAWALQMSREHNGARSLSYYELAVMLGHRDAKVTTAAGRDWNELLRQVEQLRAAVKVKADAEQAQAEAAKAEAEKAQAEAKTAGGEEQHEAEVDDDERDGS